MRTVGSQGASFQQGATTIRSLNWPVTWSARNLDTTRGINVGEICNSCDVSKESWKHSISRFPEEADSPRYNNADIYWYMGMPTHLPPAEDKVETLFALFKEEDSIL